MRIAVSLLALPLLAAAVSAGEPGLEPLPDAEWSLRHAAHLLRRAGFGGTPAEIEALHALGRDGAVDRLLEWEGVPDPDAPELRITVTARPARAEFMGKTQEERQALQRQYRQEDQQQFTRVREWWVQRMIRTAHPLRERMVLFWHGHFTSSYRDVRNSYHMYVQNTLLRRHAAGNFRTLLHEISKDPAMLEYLDNNRNHRRKPNENYAREVMELFTLGVGNYTEKDIKEAARALTGWTFSGNRFVFNRQDHDDERKTFLGRTGNFDGDEILDIILDQPAASRHLAARLFSHFAHDEPGREPVEGLARTLRAANWELEPLLRQLFRSRAFYGERAMGTKVRGPVEMLVGLHRSIDMDARGLAGLSLMAQTLGQSLMDPPNVKGWPGGREWITTSMLLNRYNMAGMLVGLPEDKLRTLKEQRIPGMGRMMMRPRVDPNGEEDDVMGKRGRRRQRARLPTYDVVGHVRDQGLSNPDEMVEYFTRALLALPPTEEMRATLTDHLTREGGFDLEGRDAQQRLHGLLRLIVSSPEFQLT
jgi:uncharacterized protein (DUF1800 family)